MLSSLRRTLALVLTLAFANSGAAQEIRFAVDYDAARREAAEKQRPLVLDFGTTDCVWCRKLLTTTFRDPGIRKVLAERFVIVRIEADRDPKLAQSLGIDSYPTLVFAGPDGKILGTHAGYVDAARFGQQLERALRESAVSPPGGGPSGSAIADRGPAEAARLLALARDDERAGLYLSCLERCRRLQTVAPNAPQIAEADRVLADIRSNPQKARQLQAALMEMLGETYLTSADTALKLGRTQEATDLLRRAQQLSPESRFAAIAQSRLATLRPNEPTIRAQAP